MLHGLDVWKACGDGRRRCDRPPSSLHHLESPSFRSLAPPSGITDSAPPARAGPWSRRQSGGTPPAGSAPAAGAAATAAALEAGPLGAPKFRKHLFRAVLADEWAQSISESHEARDAQRGRIATAPPHRTAACALALLAEHCGAGVGETATCWFARSQASPDRDKWLENHWAEVAQIEQALEKAVPGSLGRIEEVRAELLARSEQGQQQRHAGGAEGGDGRAVRL